MVPDSLRLFALELKRRGVFKVLLAYVVGAVGVSGAADVMLPRLFLPDWTVSVVVVASVLGIPVVAVLAWVFDITPSGLERTSSLSADHELQPSLQQLRNAGLAVVALLAVSAVAVILVVRSKASDDAQPYGAVAVLPFSDLSPGGGNQALAEGIAEEILTALAQIPGLRVPAAASSFQFRMRDTDIRVVGDTLRADAILDGSVTYSDGRLDIRVQLVDATDASLVWNGEYELRPIEIWSIEEEIARRVLEELGLATDAHQRRLIPAGTENPEALDFYLTYRRTLGEEEDMEDRRRRLDLLERAVAADSTFSRAWVSLAAEYTAAPSYYVISAEEAWPRAERALDRALALEPDLYEAYSVRADYLRSTGRHAEASAAYQAAIRRNPNSASAHAGLSRVFLGLGRTQEAVSEAQVAVDLNPLSAQAYGRLSASLLGARQFEPALIASIQAQELAPESHTPIANQVIVHALRGQHTRSVELAEELLELFPGDADAIHILAYALVQAGSREEAMALLPLLTGQGGAPVRPTAAALLFTHLGQADSAFAWFSRAAIDETAALYTNLDYNLYPYFDPLREDPRFQALLEQLGLR